MATLNRKLCEFPPFLWLGCNAIEVANTHRSLAMFTTECHFMCVAMVSDRMTEVASLIMERSQHLGDGGTEKWYRELPSTLPDRATAQPPTGMMQVRNFLYCRV